MSEKKMSKLFMMLLAGFVSAPLVPASVFCTDGTMQIDAAAQRAGDSYKRALEIYHSFDAHFYDRDEDAMPEDGRAMVRLLEPVSGRLPAQVHDAYIRLVRGTDSLDILNIREGIIGMVFNDTPYIGKERKCPDFVMNIFGEDIYGSELSYLTPEIYEAFLEYYQNGGE